MPPQPALPKASNMKSFKSLNRQMVQEGRPSQRHPLEGHEYHKKSDEALIHIAKDAHAAAEAMKSHNTTAENKYRDQANDSATVRYFRKKNGMPEWYKKKYGHVKEGVVEEGENNQVKDGDPCWTGYQMVGMKNKGGKKVPNCVPVKEAKEKTEYDYEGDMARGQLQSIINNAQRVHDMLKDNDNLPEWVQSKITLAEDYISTVANYMMSEVDEEVVVEASYKDTRGTLKDRLAGEVLNFHSMHDRIPSTSEFGRSVKSKPKQQAISHAKKLLGVQVKKEEVESIEEADALLARTGMNSAHKFPRAGQTNLKNIPAMNTPGNSKETDDYAEKRRGDRAKQLKPAIKAALGTHGPKGKLPEEVEPIEELSRETLLQYTSRAVPWSVTHKMIASGARQDLNFSKARHHSEKAKKREAGIKKANARLKKDSEKNYYKDHWKANRGYYGPEQPLQKEEVSKTSDATTSAEIGTPAQLSLKVTPKKLETPVYESRQLQIVREALADAKKKDAAKKKEKKVNPAGDDKFNSEPELTSSVTKNT